MTDDLNKRPGTDPAAAAGQTPPARSDDERDEVIIERNPEDSSDFKLWYNTGLTRKDAEDPEGNTQKLRDGIQSLLEAVAVDGVDHVALGDVIPEDSSLLKLLGALKGLYDSLSDLFTNGKAINALKKLHQAWEVMTENGDLLPYLTEELKKPEYNDYYTMPGLMRVSYDENGELIPDSPLDKALKAARAAFEADKEADNLPAITYKQKQDLEVTVDKISNVFLSLMAPDPKPQIDGQMSFYPVKYEGSSSKEEITLLYNYFFDDGIINQLKVKKKIDDEDFFILSILANAYQAGNTKISASKLYREMNGETPNTEQLTKFTDRLIKLASTTIYMNDKAVREAWGTDDNSTYKEIIAPLAPITIGTERYIASGKVIDSGIIIQGEPQIFNIGHAIGQFTTVPKILIQVKKKDGRSPKKTERFYQILHYLLQTIARIKGGSRKNKILYKTFYADIGATTTRAQQLARDTFFIILDHFKNCGWIKGYKEETTASTGEVGIKIIFDDTKQITSKKKK